MHAGILLLEPTRNRHVRLRWQRDITAGLSVLTDVLIMIIPAAMVWGLKMSRSKKIAVWAVMSLGWVVAIVGAVRIALYYDGFRPDKPKNTDGSYSLVYTISSAEVNM